MTVELKGAETTPPRPQAAAATPRPSTPLAGQVGKILLLGLVAALAVWGAFPLVSKRAWIALGVLAAATALVFYAYLSRRRVALKYLLPGTLLLIAFQVIPVLYTASTAFTNYGDGHRGTKQEAVTAIQSASVKQVPGSTEYQLTVATRGGGLVFLLTDSHGRAFVGDAKGLRALDPAGVTVSGGRVTAAPGYTVLTLGQASARGGEVAALSVPTTDGAIRANGLTHAFDGKASQAYRAGCDCVTDSSTGHVWRADNATGSFVDSAGQALPQGWRVNVGVSNFARVVTDSRISRPFLGAFLWNLAFALATVLTQFALGLLCALALHSPKMRGQAVYRALLVLPYAMPAFAMLLVWTDMFNQDFGLINKLFQTNVDWLGQVWTARLAVILVQMWLGYPYMFLVATGALQAIPHELTEAAELDGASGWQRLRKVTLPLLLVALSPLLIASFAFNFNNFNAIRLTTNGGPFPPTDSSVGATDLLITYTYRVAFGGQGAQFGFAAALSLYIFAIVAIISAVSFRRTRRQEEVYS
jgi:arabinogalactan oligomer/maltooligosaccharide transport system permease protein